MNIKTILVSLLVFIIAATATGCSVNSKRDYLFIGNDNVYFGMSKKGLTKKLGKPKEINNDVYDGVFDEYVYEKNLEGKSATFSYLFLNSRLTNLDISIYDIDYDTALSITKKCMANQKKYYCTDEGFYLTEIEKAGEENFSADIGVNTGAAGISFNYEYTNGNLIIYAVNQE